MATDVDSLPTPQTRLEKELVATRRLIDSADELLGAVDTSDFMTDRTPREYPRFDRNEVRFGPPLGVGGFGIVFEVKGFTLNVPQEVAIQQLNGDGEEIHQYSEEKTQIGAEDNEDSTQEENGGSDHTVELTEKAVSDGSHTSAMSTEMEQSGLKVSNLPMMEETHYNVSEARQYMYDNVRRENGHARYAVKRLHRSLNGLERARGMIDLAIEAKFLSTLWHPNIVKMRGMASGSILSPDFFIVMDRLYETLKAKMEQWKALHANARGLAGFRSDRAELERLLLERMIVAYDLAAAFWYLHDNKIVYRDIKQENIGFDRSGEPKIFDFGLCKGLSPDLKDKEGLGYLLTPRTGSVPYMAPEVAECKPYDCPCDVFSFSVLVWEMLSLATAFEGYSRREFLQRVVRGRERPRINRNWPPLTRLMIKEAWDNDPVKRPSMKRVAVLMRGDLNELTSDSKGSSAEMTKEGSERNMSSGLSRRFMRKKSR